METMEDTHHQHFQHTKEVKSANNADSEILESAFQTISLKSKHASITTDEAIETTFDFMKLRIESLEGVKQGLEDKCDSQEWTMLSLQQENALKDAKIQILEQWIRLHREKIPNQDNDLETTTRLPDETSSESGHSVDNGMMRGIGNAVLRVRSSTRARFFESVRLNPRMMMMPSTGKENSNSKNLPTSTSRSMNPSFEKAKRLDVVVGGINGCYTGPICCNDLPHGTGCIRFENGDTYLGEFAAGAMHGKGSFYHRDKAPTSGSHGGTLRGCFEQNVFIGVAKNQGEEDTRSRSSSPFMTLE